MKAFLDLIRWKNLVIVVLTMILMRYAVIAPLISKITVVMAGGTGEGIPMSLKLPWYDFTILILATLAITAAGYVINDYFDIKTDLINRGGVIVGTRIPRRQAMMWHNILNIAGVVAGFYISWKAGYFWLGTMFLLVSGLLYFYSASYRKQFLIGNIIIALMTAMVPMLVVMYEWPALYRYYAVNATEPPGLSIILYWVGGFAMFAFLTTLTREIIKDIEDFEGDVTYGKNTVPVVIGIRVAKVVSACLIFIITALLYIVWFFFINDTITLIYISVAIVLPLVYTGYLTVSSTEKNQLHRASTIMKAIMVAGILYSVVVKIILTWNLM